MTAFGFVALSQARVGLALVNHALENIERETSLDAHHLEQVARLRHTVVDWSAFLDALIEERR